MIRFQKSVEKGSDCNVYGFITAAGNLNIFILKIIIQLKAIISLIRFLKIFF